MLVQLKSVKLWPLIVTGIPERFFRVKFIYIYDLYYTDYIIWILFNWLEKIWKIGLDGAQKVYLKCSDKPDIFAIQKKWKKMRRLTWRQQKYFRFYSSRIKIVSVHCRVPDHCMNFSNRKICIKIIHGIDCLIIGHIKLIFENLLCSLLIIIKLFSKSFCSKFSIDDIFCLFDLSIWPLGFDPKVFCILGSSVGFCSIIYMSLEFPPNTQYWFIPKWVTEDHEGKKRHHSLIGQNLYMVYSTFSH